MTSAVPRARGLRCGPQGRPRVASSLFFPHSSSGYPRNRQPALLPQRLRPWAARGADDVGRGAGLPASCAAAARDAVRSGVAGGGLRGRRVGRGGRAAEEEPGSQPPPSRPTEFPGLPQPFPRRGCFRGRPGSPARLQPRGGNGRLDRSRPHTPAGGAVPSPRPQCLGEQSGVGGGGRSCAGGSPGRARLLCWGELRGPCVSLVSHLFSC